jgi:phage baseplate assembly protein W
MAFVVPSNFRQLPQVWEIAQPFRIAQAGTSIQGPASLPGLNWTGPWSGANQYNPWDAVIYSNSAWYALQGNSDVVPGSDGTIWSLIPPLIGGGAVAFDTDPVTWAKNHILALCLTNPGERVMMPTYGIGLLNYVFSPNDPFTEQTLITLIQQSVSMWEGNITINSCSLVPQPQLSSIMEISIEFTVGGNPTNYTVNVSLGGTGIEVQV